MGIFSLWVDALVPDSGGGFLAGSLLGRADHRETDSHDGPILALSQDQREILDLSIHEVHVASLSGFGWMARPLPSLQPPFLLTADLETQVRFAGSVAFDPTPRYRSLTRYGVAGLGWVGAMVVKRSWFAAPKYRLLAFSSDSAARVEDGELFAPGAPDVAVGTLTLAKERSGAALAR